MTANEQNPTRNNNSNHEHNAPDQSPKRERGSPAQGPKRKRGSTEQSPTREQGLTEQSHHDRVPALPAPPAAGSGSVANASGSDGSSKPPGASGSAPLAYLITFTTHGSWLPGDERGSVDREHNVYQTPYVTPNPRRRAQATDGRNAHPVSLDHERRSLVRQTIIEVSAHRGWTLHELNVRTNHVHVVVAAPHTPERIMSDLKAGSTRRLREHGLFDDRQSPWTEHGSTRYLWKPDHLAAACRYVLDSQGPDI